MPNRAQEGDTVTVSYQGFLEDGRVFDASDEDEPLVFILGEDTVLAGFERAVIGMEPGESKTVQVPPEEGFGMRLDHLVDKVDVETLPAELDVEVGSQLEVIGENGHRFEVTVTGHDFDQVTIDANHPLAGHTLTFHIELLAIHRPTIN